MEQIDDNKEYSDYCASMEPLPFRSGMAIERRIAPQASGWASMEPLPFRSGMNQAQRSQRRHSTASMEPLPFRSGMHIFGFDVNARTLPLQWSRSHSGAE